MAANRAHGLLDNRFVPMMITRIILSLKRAASTPLKFEMVDASTRFQAVSRGLQGTQELRYDKGNVTFSHPVEHGTQ